MEYGNMSKEALKTFIRTKKAEVEALRDEIVTSENVNEARGLTRKLTELRKMINDASDAMGKIEDDESGKYSTPLDPMKAYGMRTLGVYNQERNHSHSVIKEKSLALRQGEPFPTQSHSDDKLDLGKYIRGMVSGDWNGAEVERRAMTSSASGVLIPEILSGTIIDMARNQSLFTLAGVPVYPMPEGNLTIARVASDPVFSFKAEGAEQSNGNDFTLDSIDLKAKTAYGYCYVSRESILSAKNLTDIMYRVFSGAMADCIDKALLYGQYDSTNGKFETFAPAGIMNDVEINSVEASNVNFNDYVKAVGAIRRNNGTPTVLGINGATEEIISMMADTTGQPLNMPKNIEMLKLIISNQLKSNEVDGNDALVFDPSSMVIGMQNLITIKMVESSDYAIKHNMVGFQIYCMLDSVIVRPSHITVINGLKEASVS